MNWTWVNRLTVNKRRQTVSHNVASGSTLASTPGSMATSQLISFYASLTAPLQLGGINGTGSISLLAWAQRHIHKHVYIQKHTPGPPLSGLPGQLLQLNTLHNNLFANSCGAQWCLIFHNHHNRKQVFCHRLLPLPCRRLKLSGSR